MGTGDRLRKFFPIDVAIALTGVVHFTNNLFKIALVGRNNDKTVGVTPVKTDDCLVVNSVFDT